MILPVFNSEKSIVRAVDSVLNQTYSNLELIIINDGSTDATLDILHKKYISHPKIRIITQPNYGVTRARENGVNKAVGKYITFIDSDDYLKLDMYENMIAEFQKHDADIVECGYIRVENVKSNVFQLRNQVTKGIYKNLKKFLMNKNCTNFLWNKIYKKELFNDINIRPYKYSEDYYLNVLIHSKAEIKITIQDAFYYYVDNPGSVVNQPFTEAKFDVINVGKEVDLFISEKFPGLRVYSVIYILTSLMALYKEINNERSDYLISQYESYYRRFKKDIFISAVSLKLKIKLMLFFLLPDITSRI